MAKTILQVKEDLEGLIHSTSLAKVRNLNAVFQRSARNLLTKIDPADTVRMVQITNAVHDEIYDYSAPSDLKGRKIIDIRPQHSRQKSENVHQTFSRRFDLEKDDSSFQIRYNKGTKTLRLALALTTPLLLNECDSLTANGTWAADGTGATNLTRDTLDFMSGSASLNFDLAVSQTTGYIENSTMSQVDLTDYDEIGSIFVRVYIPDTSIITNFILRWGNDTSNYWSRTVTAPHDQSTLKTGWQILRFDWNGATETGTVAPATIDYLRLTVTYDGTAETDLRVDKISASSGEIWEMEYYSECLFSTSGGTWQTTTTDDSDIINLDEDGINIFEYECVISIAQQLQGADGAFDYNFARNMLGLDEKGNIVGGLYAKYQEAHPSEAIRPRNIYFDVNLYSK